jgi:hypothetical protein
VVTTDTANVFHRRHHQQEDPYVFQETVAEYCAALTLAPHPFRLFQERTDDPKLDIPSFSFCWECELLHEIGYGTRRHHLSHVPISSLTDCMTGVRNTLEKRGCPGGHRSYFMFPVGDSFSTCRNSLNDDDLTRLQRMPKAHQRSVDAFMSGSHIIAPDRRLSIHLTVTRAWTGVETRKERSDTLYLVRLIVAESIPDSL